MMRHYGLLCYRNKKVTVNTKQTILKFNSSGLEITYGQEMMSSVEAKIQFLRKEFSEKL